MAARDRRRRWVDVVILVIGAAVTLAFWFAPGGGSPVTHGIAGANPNMSPPPPSGYNPPPPSYNSNPCPDGYTHVVSDNNGVHSEKCVPPGGAAPPAGNFAPQPKKSTATTQPAGNFVTGSTQPAYSPTANVVADVPDAGAQACSLDSLGSVNGHAVQLISSQPCQSLDEALINSGVPTKAQEPNNNLRVLAVLLLLLALFFGIAGESIFKLLAAIRD